MSREDLVNAYLSGEISRRVFMRRLVGAGVSLAAAGAYAQLLVPAPARADYGYDLYGRPVKGGSDFYNPPAKTDPPQGAPSGPGSVQPPDKTGPAASLSIEDTTLGELLSARRLSVDVSSSESAKIKLVATLASRRKGRKGRKLGSAGTTLSEAGGVTIGIGLGRSARRALVRARGGSIVVTGTVTDSAGNASPLSARTSALP